MDEEAGPRIRELRRERGLSQVELVVPGLLSGSYLSLIEAGRRRPSLEVLRHLAGRLDCSVEYLATGRHPADWHEIEQRLAFAEMTILNGSAAEALAGFEAVLASGRERLRDRAALGRARALELCGRGNEAAAEFEALWQAAEPGTTAWAERAIDMMRCARECGDLAYAIEAGEQALAVFERLGLEWSDAAIRLGVSLSGAYLTRGDMSRAARLVERFIEISERVDSQAGRGAAYWNAALVAAHEQRYADAALLAERALALLAETAYVRNVAMLRSIHGELLIPTDPHRAREVLVDARERMIPVDSRADLGRTEDILAVAALRLGEVEEALRWSLLATERLLGTDHAYWTAVAFTTRAEIAHLQGDDEAVEAALATVDRVLDDRPVAADAVTAWSRVAALHEARGDTTRALLAYRDALAATGTPPAARI